MLKDGYLRLDNDDLAIEVDPGHGAEVLLLALQRDGENLLWRAPWVAAPAAEGALEEQEWMAGYRGGWQELFPNAGNSCTHAGKRHGFHGAASNSPWQVLEYEPLFAHLKWTDGELSLDRRMRIGPGPVVRYEERVTLTGQRERSFVWVHHPAFGGPLLRPGCALDVPAGSAYVLDERTGPTTPPLTADPWPLVGGDDWSKVALDSTLTRFGCLTNLKAGWAAIRNSDANLGVALAWPLEVFPHLWTYQDVHGVSSEPWLGRGEFVMLEPASVPHSLGLDFAAARRQAISLMPGATLESWLTLAAFQPRGRVINVHRNGRIEHAGP